MGLEFVRAIESNHPGEIGELYRSGDQYLYVWTIPADLPDAEREGGTELRFWASADGSSEERSACFHADVDANVTDWKPITVATGPGSRDKVFAQLRGAASHATD